MRKYNMNGDNQNCPPAGGGRSFPFFDVPCLYYPQYPCNWGAESRCDMAYGIYSLSYHDANESNLELNSCVQDGRAIQLNSDNESINLLPGKLYLVNYHVKAVGSSLAVAPVVDGVSDLCNGSYTSGNGGELSVSGSLLLPVVETPSTLQIQLQNTNTYPEQLSGSVSIVALGSL